MFLWSVPWISTEMILLSKWHKTSLGTKINVNYCDGGDVDGSDDDVVGESDTCVVEDDDEELWLLI